MSLFGRFRDVLVKLAPSWYKKRIVAEEAAKDWQLTRACTCCQKIIDMEYEYCPRCGTSLVERKTEEIRLPDTENMRRVARPVQPKTFSMLMRACKPHEHICQAYWREISRH